MSKRERGINWTANRRKIVKWVLEHQSLDLILDYRFDGTSSYLFFAKGKIERVRSSLQYLESRGVLKSETTKRDNLLVERFTLADSVKSILGFVGRV
jgi:hypothetical protein